MAAWTKDRVGEMTVPAETAVALFFLILFSFSFVLRVEGLEHSGRYSLDLGFIEIWKFPNIYYTEKS